MIPDDMSLAIYEAGARSHLITLVSLDKTFNQSNETEQVNGRLLAKREQARIGLRVMQALAAAWRRDVRDRKEHDDARERDIRERYSRKARNG